MDAKKIIGENIRRLRKKHNLTQEELAAKLGITRQQLHRIETGEQGTTVDRLDALASIFDVPRSYFLEDHASNGQSRAWMDKLSPHLREALEKDIDKFLPYFRIVEKATLNDLSPMTLDAIVEAFLQAREIDEQAKRERLEREHREREKQTHNQKDEKGGD